MSNRDVEPGGFPESMPAAVREFPPTMQLMWLAEQGVGFFEPEELRRWTRVIRQRANRQAASADKAAKDVERPSDSPKTSGAMRQQKLRDELAREREIAARLVRRWFPHGPPAIMVMRFEYWQALACGWDALSRAYSRDRIGLPVEVSSGHAWEWWTELDRKSRKSIVTAHRVSLVRRHRLAA